MKKGFALFTLIAFLSISTIAVFAQDETNTETVEQTSEDVSETTTEESQFSDNKEDKEEEKFQIMLLERVLTIL